METKGDNVIVARDTHILDDGWSETESNLSPSLA